MRRCLSGADTVQGSVDSVEQAVEAATKFAGELSMSQLYVVVPALYIYILHFLIVHLLVLYISAIITADIGQVNEKVECRAGTKEL